MLVRLVGFSIDDSPYIPVTDLLAGVAGFSQQIEESDGYGRFAFVDSDSNEQYHLGLVVTVKNQRKFCELKETDGEFRVIVKNLGSESRIMEFNFFVLNKKTRRGLYQHYHQSCSVGQALLLIQNRHKSLVTKLKDERVSELKAQGRTAELAEKIAKKEFSKRLRWSQLVTKEALPKILQQLAEIKFLEVDLQYLEPDASDFKQLTGFVKRQRRRFVFRKKSTLSELISAITGVVSNTHLQRGKVGGVDSDGIDRFVKIKDNPDVFGEYDYDDVAEHINNLDVKAFSKSWMILELLEVCETNNAMFSSPSK